MLGSWSIMATKMSVPATRIDASLLRMAKVITRNRPWLMKFVYSVARGGACRLFAIAQHDCMNPTASFLRFKSVEGLSMMPKSSSR